MSNKLKTQVLVLGGGPGGYTAAFRAADLGLEVTLVEAKDTLGGVCLNVGCIPSKALLYVVETAQHASSLEDKGVLFEKPVFDVDKLRAYKDQVVTRLTGGLKMLAKKRKVSIVQGEGQFISPHELRVLCQGEETIIEFDFAIIAAGSRPVSLPFLPKDERILDSTSALSLKKTDGEFLIIGGGIIGLEMATVYQSLGAHVTIVELLPQLIAPADKDMVAPFERKLKKEKVPVLLETKVTQVEAKDDGLYVTFEGKKAAQEPVRFDQILCAVGRVPNGLLVGAEKAGANVDARGYITVNEKMQTSVSHIFAIGDIVSQPMLAHKAVAEGRIAAEVIAGLPSKFEPKCIPSVAYTDPEIAWVGLTEKEALEQGIEYGKGEFPWAASGRSLSMGRNEGKTKLLFDKYTEKLIGAGIVGQNAGELIGEMALAIRLGATAKDIASTIHPHPTLCETMMMASEVFEGTVTDL